MTPERRATHRATPDPFRVTVTQPMSQPYLMSLLFVLGLLGVGFALRAGLRPLRTLFVPASVVGGLVGLCVMQAGLRVGAGGSSSAWRTPIQIR